ncbi:hypothetical protein [Amycolatopsis bartoniae]|uniref:hypothetical protein n=1 Tax=Amycolatopsis bartoniae TaxID=941986 RepID=UPI0035D460E3
MSFVGRPEFSVGSVLEDDYDRAAYDDQMNVYKRTEECFSERCSYLPVCGGGCAYGRAGFWRTRATPAEPSVLTCADGTSRRPFPERRDQQANRLRRGRAGGRPPAFDQVAYRRRNIVERCFNRLKQFRAIATRFDKTTTSYRSMIDLATLLIWL